MACEDESRKVPTLKKLKKENQKGGKAKKRKRGRKSNREERKKKKQGKKKKGVRGETEKLYLLSNIYEDQAIDFRRSKRQSSSTRRELRVGTRI